MATVTEIRRNRRVEDVSVEEGGDLLMVTLARGWARYGTGCIDGTVKGFQIDEVDPKGEDETYTAHVVAALEWVRNDVQPCDCPRCAPVHVRKHRK